MNNFDDIGTWYSSLSDSDKPIFLAEVMGYLTIHGRAFGVDLSGEKQIKAFKGLNELQHKISFHFAGIGLNNERYPDSVFIQVLRETASSLGMSAHLEQSLDYARKRPHWGLRPE
jgi:hypothetical protein